MVILLTFQNHFTVSKFLSDWECLGVTIFREDSQCKPYKADQLTTMYKGGRMLKFLIADETKNKCNALALFLPDFVNWRKMYVPARFANPPTDQIITNLTNRCRMNALSDPGDLVETVLLNVEATEFNALQYLVKSILQFSKKDDEDDNYHYPSHFANALLIDLWQHVHYVHSSTVLAFCPVASLPTRPFVI